MLSGAPNDHSKKPRWSASIVESDRVGDGKE